MNILTKRNGIALVAVLVVLLVLTLLLPLMFTMSENATRSAMKGTDELRSSYLARTMVEMSVSAFEDCYDAALEDKDAGVPLTNKESDYYKMNEFMTNSKKITVGTLYMFSDNSVQFPENLQKPSRADYGTDQAYKQAYDAFILANYDYYMEHGVVYTTKLPSGVTKTEDLKQGTKYVVTAPNKDGTETTYTDCSYVGKAECNIVYDDQVEYYKTTLDPDTGAYKTEKLPNDTGASEYNNYITGAAKNPSSLSNTQPQYSKIEKRNVVFQSFAHVNGKSATRKCILVLPTKPAENNWIVPAQIESNQIFPDTSKASSVKTLNMNSSYFIDEAAVKNQPVYIFSCIGNMVISSKDIKYEGKDYNTYVADYNLDVKTHNDAIDAHNAQVQANINNGVENPGSFRNDYKEYIDNQFADFSLGLHPVTTTLNPENDPTFSCVKTNNMRTWAGQSRRDNFVAFTATSGIQIDMPVNLLINPCRTGRIGDGIASNQSLYKVMYFQAPTIVFNNSVNSFVSLYQKNTIMSAILDYNAYRMTSIMLAAPQSTPYSYFHNSRNKTVKAGKVFFAEDAYIWLVPFTENGSNYKTQTVYYKGKDIILYKFANAGDVFLFNSDVMTNITVNGKSEPANAGFSMTGYFMDVIYNRDETRTNDTKWYQFWSQMQNWIFDGVQSYTARDATYVEEDLKWLGNMYGGASDAAPLIDDFYVIWES